MKFKKLFKSVAAITLAFCLSIPANAAAVTQSAPTLEEIAELNRINAPKYAISFIDEMFNSPGLQSGSVSEIYDEYDHITGYCVDLVNGNDPSGYVIIDVTADQPIVMDFCIELNAQNPFDTISETFELSVNNEFYYSFEPFDYYVYIPQDNILAGRDGQTELTQSFETYKANVASINISECDKQNLNDSVEPYADKYSDVAAVVTDTFKGKYVDGDWIYGAKTMSFYSETDVDRLGYDYCCGVVFACNLLKYLHETKNIAGIYDNLRELYPIVYKVSEADSDGVDVYDAVDAALEYLYQVGHPYKFGKYWLKLFSDYKRDVKKDQPSLFYYYGMTSTGIDGHGVLVVGYLESDENKYLCVADGWFNYPRYLNYSGGVFKDEGGGTFYAA